MSRGLMSVALASSLMAGSALAASKSLTFSDGICQYRVAYDPAKYDRKALKETLDYLASGDPPMELGPTLNEPDDVKSIDLKQYRSDCATHRKKLEAPHLIDAPGLEDLRKHQITELDDACQMIEAKLKAAKGEPAALRGYTPAGEACNRYADAMATPDAKLRTVYDDMLVDLCKTSTEPGICRGNLQKEGEKPQREVRMRLAILTQGWVECASPHMLVNKGGPGTDVEGVSDRMKRELKDKLLKSLHAKALSCAQ